MKGVIVIAMLLMVIAIGITFATSDATIKDEGAPLLLAAPMIVPTKGGKKTEIKEACKIIKELMLPLEKERRTDILRSLPLGEKKSFGQLQEETGISAGSLHDHLKVLLELGYIHSTNERPARYYSNEYVEKLCELATYWKARKIEELTKKLGEFQEGDASSERITAI